MNIKSEIIATDKTASDLKAKGFTGLFVPGECACTIDDFAPCGESNADCEMGYAFKDPKGTSEYEFIVKRENKEPTDDEWIELRQMF